MVMEDLKDPHNISAVIRTSEIFGLQDVHIIEEVNPYNVSKSILCGSIKWLNIFKHSLRLDCMNHLRKSGYQIAVASSQKGVPLDEMDLSKPTAFYLGSESLGNHPETLKAADVQFRIPQFGFTESMNVSVCAGVLMSTLASYMKRHGRENFLLSEAEKLKLKADYFERSSVGFEQNSPITKMES
ncbi:MAG: RNA methyltransferase [Fibrobacteria bacterium]|nr:RNA methyltransferase [Fibrobacteria bacterium]